MVAELLLGQPIFPGDSGVDQLVEIIKVRKIFVLFFTPRTPVWGSSPSFDSYSNFIKFSGN